MKDRDTVPKPSPHHPSLEAVCHPKCKLILNSCLFQPASPGSLYFPVCAMAYSRYLCKHHLVALALWSLLSALDLTGFQTNLLDAQFPQSLGGGGVWGTGREEQSPFIFPKESQKCHLTKAHETEACRWVRETRYPHPKARAKGWEGHSGYQVTLDRQLSSKTWAWRCAPVCQGGRDRWIPEGLPASEQPCSVRAYINKQINKQVSK